MLIERLAKKGNDHVANKQTLLGEFSSVGHGGQKDGEGVKNDTYMELEKREWLSMPWRNVGQEKEEECARQRLWPVSSYER